MTNNNKLFILIGAILILISPVTEAVDIGATAEVGVGTSDNIARTSSNELDEDIVAAGLNISLVEESQNVTADIKGRVIRFDYRDNTFRDETLASVNAQLLLGSSDSIFTWMAQDNYGQQMVNVFEPATPNNRENVNAFTTGPGIRLPFGRKTSLNIGVRYTDMNYEIRPQDNERLWASLQLLRKSTPTRNLALVVNGMQIAYDDQTANVDVDLLQAFGRYELNAARTNVSVDLGWNEIDSILANSSGLLAAILVDRQTSPFGNLSLQLGSRFSDAGDVFTRFQRLGGRGVSQFGDDVTGDIRNTTDPFQLNYASVDYGIKRDRTTWGIGAAYRDEEYEVQTDFDRTLTTYKLDFSTQVSRHIRFFVYGRFVKREFDTRNRFDEDLGYGGGIAWLPGRRLTISLDYYKLDRDSNVPAAEYQESRVFLTVQYILLKSAADQ